MHVWQALYATLKHMAIDFCYAFTEYPGHATVLARQAVTAGYDACVGVGGDGTLSEIVPALLGTATALACVPAGTGNDFARGLGWPRLPEQVVTLLTTAARRRIDVPRVNGRCFLNVASAGFDAVVADAVNQRFKAFHGTLAYLLGLFTTLFSYHNVPLVIRFDDEAPMKCKALLVAVGNLSYYGGGMKICPQATPHDGLLDVCVAGDITKGDALITLPRLSKGTHLSHPKCTYRRCQTVFVDGPPLPIQADGQIVGSLPATFTVQPSALWALVPAQHPIGQTGEVLR